MGLLNPAQVATLKTYLGTDPDQLGLATPVANGDVGAIMAIMNAPNTKAFWGIRNDADGTQIRNNILFANYTPAVAVLADGTNAAIAMANSNYCIGKQVALQNILPPLHSTFDATQGTLVAGLKDATTKVPAGAAFAQQNGGWNTIPTVLSRLCTWAEKLFAVANTTVPALTDGSSPLGTPPSTGAVGNPATMAVQGQLGSDDIQAALAN